VVHLASWEIQSWPESRPRSIGYRESHNRHDCNLFQIIIGTLRNRPKIKQQAIIHRYLVLVLPRHQALLSASSNVWSIQAMNPSSQATIRHNLARIRPSSIASYKHMTNIHLVCSRTMMLFHVSILMRLSRWSTTANRHNLLWCAQHHLTTSRQGMVVLPKQASD
jgi:hypothetical protein